MLNNRTKVRRRVLACARCRKRKLSCDGKVPACTRCTDAGVACVGFDSSTQKEAPRSLADFLEAHIASLQSPSSPSSSQPALRCVVPASSPAASHDSRAQQGPWRTGLSTYADSLVNQVMEDITPPFLGVSKTRPILSCVVRGSQLPSRKGPVGSKDLDAGHPKSIMNPQSPTGCLDGIDVKAANRLLANYLDRVITQYPIYHRNEVTTAFSSVYRHPTSSGPETPKHRYITSIIMAISLSTAARTKQKKASALAYTLVRQALQYVPEVATNDIGGLQAILLLTQYIFLNPGMADLWLLTGMISQAVLDLGLHQELPEDARITRVHRDMRRRLFWIAWEMEVGVCCIFQRPINLPIRNIEVAFPVEVDDVHITEAGIDDSGHVTKFTSRQICQFRLIEAEIFSVMRNCEPVPRQYASMEQWMSHCESAIAEWQQDIYAAAEANQDPAYTERWNEMKLYSDIVIPYIYVALYRPYPVTNPTPTTKQAMILFESAVKVADGYYKQCNADFGRIKYVFHPCHHVFNCADIFLRVLQSRKQEISERFDWNQIQEWMQCFSSCFRGIAERWTVASRCLEEYERELAGIKKEYEEFLYAKANQPPLLPQTDMVMSGMTDTFQYEPVPNMDEALNFCTVFSNTTTAEYAEPLSAIAYSAPQDWSKEFSLLHTGLPEMIPQYAAAVPI